MKMIYDSQERQERLHQAIADAQKNAPMLPAVTALAHQELLKEQIKDLESQLAALPPDKPTTSYGFADQWNDNQLRQLEDDLKALERNYLQLKELMAAMTKKSQNGRMSADQHVEEQKLQNNIDDLKRQGISLRVDFDELRSQMVDLDKRKSHLEDMIKQLP